MKEEEESRPEGPEEEQVETVTQTDFDELLAATAAVAHFKAASREEQADSSQFIYFPSQQTVELVEKLGSGCQARFLVEEGIYVPTVPQVRWKMRSKMENRLVAAKHKDVKKRWFQEDGELKSCEEEMLDAPRRPNLDEDNIFIGTVFRDCEHDVEGFIPSSEAMILLELQVNSLHFTQHPFFTAEHSLAHRLTETFHCYQKKKAARSFERLSKRLTALRHACDLLRSKTDDQNDEKIIRYEFEIKDLRTTTLLEGAAERSVQSAVLSAWEKLQELRENQGFVGCPTRLIVSQGTLSDGRRKVEERHWKNSLKQLVLELRREQAEETEGGPDLVEKANKLLGECLKPPGEPDLSFEVVHDLETSRDSKSLKAQSRLQNLLRKQRVQLRIMYNGSEVCQSMPYTLDSQSFSTVLAILLPLSATQWPQNFSVQIIEQSAIKKSLITEVSLPLPEKGCTRESAAVQKVFFGSETHSGYLVCKTGWGSDAEGNLRQPSARFWQTAKGAATKKHAPKTAEALNMWIEKSRMDPNNPLNSELISKLKECALDDTCSDPMVSDLDFCSEAEFQEANLRLKILELREQGHPGFCSMKMIPPNARELPEGLLKEYKERSWQQNKQAHVIEEEADDSLANHRAWALNSLRAIKEKIQRQGRLASRRKTQRELVTEDLVPDIGTLGLTLMTWLQPSRPLRPERKARSSHAPFQGGAASQPSSLLVNVVSALQVPTRKHSQSTEPFGAVAVRPFVEVTFGGAAARTRAADGANPTWNHQLQLPIEEQVFGHELITIQLFDEIVVDVLADERLREIDVHTRQERAWLGSISIPFAAVQRFSKIDGTFPLDSQPLLLGYEQEDQNRQFGPLLAPVDSPRQVPSSTFLNLFITLQPPLLADTETSERLECMEGGEVERHLENWSCQVSSAFPDRKVPSVVATANGKTTCITRFFRPIKPPEFKENGGRTVSEMVSRFVSLIPRTTSNVCLSADEILKLCYGDSLSNAILLTCFLQGLGEEEAWLLVGWGLTRGPAHFVLTKNKEHQASIWDVQTGTKTSTDDPFCPATLVWAVANQDNIWANVQREISPRRMRFDFSKMSDWSPAFVPAGPAVAPGPEAVMQPETLNFVKTPPENCKELATRLERILKDNFMSWRTSLRTRWNRHCSSVLRKVLHLLENQSGSKKAAIRELQPLEAAHKMIGFPLQLSYTDDKDVIRSLYSTQVHTLRDSEIEFGLAVAAFPFPNNAVSVWIFIAALAHRA